jgi:hypothetical protein
VTTVRGDAHFHLQTRHDHLHHRSTSKSSMKLRIHPKEKTEPTQPEFEPGAPVQTLKAITGYGCDTFHHCYLAIID